MHTKRSTTLILCNQVYFIFDIDSSQKLLGSLTFYNTICIRTRLVLHKSLPKQFFRSHRKSTLLLSMSSARQIFIHSLGVLGAKLFISVFILFLQVHISSRQRRNDHVTHLLEHIPHLFFTHRCTTLFKGHTTPTFIPKYTGCLALSKSCSWWIWMLV